MNIGTHTHTVCVVLTMPGDLCSCRACYFIAYFCVFFGVAGFCIKRDL